MLLRKLREHLIDVIFIGAALALIGGAGGFFSGGILGALLGSASGFAAGVGISVVLVGIYSVADGRGQPLSVVPPVDTILSSQVQRMEAHPCPQTDHAVLLPGNTED
jgi:hypothetical protein